MNQHDPERLSAPGQTTLVDNVLHPLAIQISNLLTLEGRASHGEILVDDEENILQSIRAGQFTRVVFRSDDCELSNALKSALQPGTQQAVVAKRTAKKLFGNERLSRIFSVVRMPERIPLEQLAERRGDVLVLDNLKISGNVGAIVRTAFAFGAGAVVVLDAKLEEIFDRRTIRSSRGYVFRLPIVCSSTNEFIEFVTRHQQFLVATAARASVPVDQIAADPRRVFFLLGAEKEGCSDLLQRHASAAVSIPIQPESESLNVSVATGILLYARGSRNRSQASG